MVVLAVAVAPRSTNKESQSERGERESKKERRSKIERRLREGERERERERGPSSFNPLPPNISSQI